MADPKPRLVALGTESEAAGSGEPAAAPPPTERGASRGAFVAAVLLAVLLGLGLAAQSRRAGELAGRVEILGLELGAARAEIAAHERRMDRVRASVDDLQTQIAGLDALVNAPASSPPKP